METIKDIADLCMRNRDLIRQGRQLLLDVLQVLDTYKLPFEYTQRVRVRSWGLPYVVDLHLGRRDGTYFSIPHGYYAIISAASLSQPGSEIEDKYIILVLKSLPEHLKRLKDLLTSEHNMLQKVIDELKAYLDSPEVATILVSKRLQEASGPSPSP
ncbi:MAG: hypothetical protein QW650_00935 [Thermofilum sp.]